MTSILQTFPLHMTKGERFQARIDLAWWEPESQCDEATIREKFKDSNFGKLNVWRAEDHWWVAGVWEGDNAVLERDDVDGHLKLIWELVP